MRVSLHPPMCGEQMGGAILCLHTKKYNTLWAWSVANAPRVGEFVTVSTAMGTSAWNQLTGCHELF